MTAWVMWLNQNIWEKKWLGRSNNEVGIEGGGEGWQKSQAEAGKYSELTPNIKFQLK